MGRLAERGATHSATAGGQSARRARMAGPPRRRGDGLHSYRYDADGTSNRLTDRSRGVDALRTRPVGRLLSSIPEKPGGVLRYDRQETCSRPGADPDREYGKGNRLLRHGTDNLSMGRGRGARGESKDVGGPGART